MWGIRAVNSRMCLIVFISLCGVESFIAGPAFAGNLRDAMGLAYSNNPTLRAARAQLRATDENIAQALSNWRPTLSATGSIGTQETQSFFAGSTTLNPQRAGVTLNQNIYRGGRTINETRQADSEIKAGRSGLVATEQNVLLQTVTAYMDVIRDTAVLKLNQNNIDVLRRQLQATKDRFRVGEITRTDVAQAEARLSGSISNRAGAEAVLTESRAIYQAVVGQMPGTLEPPPPLPELPASEERALKIAMEKHPDLLAAQFNEEATRYGVAVAKGTLLPTLDFRAAYNENKNTFRSGVSTNDKTLQAQITIPLYQGGQAYSSVRQAKQRNQQRRYEIEDARRQIIRGVISAWDRYRATQAQIKSRQEQVRANEIALEGVRQEAAVGSRTTLDVLDAEQELLDSNVLLVQAERDQYVAGYTLLAATGHLSARDLALGVDYYDPEKYYRSARSRWFGWPSDSEQ